MTLRKTTGEMEFGGSRIESEPSSDVFLTPPWQANGGRLHVSTGASPTIRLPKANIAGLDPGGLPQYVVCNDHATVTKTVDTFSGITSVATLTPGDCVELRLLDDSTLDGTWAATVFTRNEDSSALDPERVVYEISLTVNPVVDFNLRDFVEEQFGYDGTRPVSIKLTVKAGVMVGSSDSTTYAFATGLFPAGSTLLLYVESGAWIHGKGGGGGRGGSSALLAANGTDGGTALAIEMDTALVNYGFVQGGGGGGGGGSYVSPYGGGGGGGGAGYQVAAGGNGGSPDGGNGEGGAWTAGIGGSSPAGASAAGGDGGTYATAGSNAGGNGGAAGDSIHIYSATGSLTILQTGTITGTQVTY